MTPLLGTFGAASARGFGWLYRAALGVETWIIVPVLPYYMWALPGDSTPWYDSVTLFRQEEYGNWDAPFKKIQEKLQEKIKSR